LRPPHQPPPTGHGHRCAKRTFRTHFTPTTPGVTPLFRSGPPTPAPRRPRPFSRHPPTRALRPQDRHAPGSFPSDRAKSANAPRFVHRGRPGGHVKGCHPRHGWMALGLVPAGVIAAQLRQPRGAQQTPGLVGFSSRPSSGWGSRQGNNPPHATASVKAPRERSTTCSTCRWDHRRQPVAGPAFHPALRQVGGKFAEPRPPDLAVERLASQQRRRPLRPGAVAPGK